MMNKEKKDALFAELAERLEKRDAVFSLDGPMMITVKLEDNTYRKKTIGARDFYLGSIYSGAKDIIFVFQDEEITTDVREYSCIEVPAKEMDDAFPMFLDEFKEWARTRFVPREASRFQAIVNVQSVKELVELTIKFETLDVVTETSDSDDTLATLPNFGMF